MAWVTYKDGTSLSRIELLEAEEVLSAQEDVLQRVFSGCTSLSDAATQLTKLCLFQDVSPETGLGRFWGLVTRTASHSCVHHEKLAELLVYLSKMPPAKTAQGEVFEIYEMQVWKDLPMLTWAFRDCWNLHPNPLYRQPSDDRNFININRFAANLVATEEMVFDYDWFGLVTLRDALETTQAAGTYNIMIIAAAPWMEILGAEMYDWDHEFPHGGNLGAPGRGGPLWDESQHGFCEERWLFWKQRFGEFATKNKRISEEARTVAGECHRMMEEIENGEIE